MARHGTHETFLHPEHEQSVDLRRKKRAEMASELVTRAKWLPAEERELIRTVYEHGRPVSELAPLLCVSPRTLRRRCRKAVSRALSDEYIFVLRNRDRWPEMLARVATMCIIEGKSLRTAAASLNISFHTARRYRTLVVGMLEAAAMAAPAVSATPAFAPAWQQLDEPTAIPSRGTGVSPVSTSSTNGRPHRVIKKAKPLGADRRARMEGQL